MIMDNGTAGDLRQMLEQHADHSEQVSALMGAIADYVERSEGGQAPAGVSIRALIYLAEELTANTKVEAQWLEERFARATTAGTAAGTAARAQ